MQCSGETIAHSSCIASSVRSLHSAIHHTDGDVRYCSHDCATLARLFHSLWRRLQRGKAPFIAGLVDTTGVREGSELRAENRKMIPILGSDPGNISNAKVLYSQVWYKLHRNQFYSSSGLSGKVLYLGAFPAIPVKPDTV